MLKAVRHPSFVRWQSSALAISLLVSMTPALCQAAYDPPSIHVTPQDMQALVQCYLGASDRGALSTCDKQAAAVRTPQRNAEHELQTEQAKAKPQRPPFEASLVSPAYLSGAATLFGLSWLSAVLFRVGRAKHKAVQPYFPVGNSSCS